MTNDYIKQLEAANQQLEYRLNKLQPRFTSHYLRRDVNDPGILVLDGFYYITNTVTLVSITYRVIQYDIHFNVIHKYNISGLDFDICDIVMLRNLLEYQSARTEDETKQLDNKIKELLDKAIFGI